MRKIDADLVEERAKKRAFATGATGQDRLEACAVLQALKEAPTVEETARITTREELTLTMPVTRHLVPVCGACGVDVGAQDNYCRACGRHFIREEKGHGTDRKGEGHRSHRKAAGAGRPRRS